MKKLLCTLLAFCLACGLAVLPAMAVEAEPAEEWRATSLFDPASGVGVRVETRDEALEWRLYVSQPLDGGWLALLTTEDGRTAEQVAQTVPVRLAVTVPGEPWVYHAVPGEQVVAGPEGAASFGLVGMNVDGLLVLDDASIAWAAPAGWLPDAYWERHGQGDAAGLAEQEPTEQTACTAKQTNTAAPLGDDVNPNTGL